MRRRRRRRCATGRRTPRSASSSAWRSRPSATPARCTTSTAPRCSSTPRTSRRSRPARSRRSARCSRASPGSASRARCRWRSPPPRPSPPWPPRPATWPRSPTRRSRSARRRPARSVPSRRSPGRRRTRTRTRRRTWWRPARSSGRSRRRGTDARRASEAGGPRDREGRVQPAVPHRAPRRRVQEPARRCRRSARTSRRTRRRPRSRLERVDGDEGATTRPRSRSRSTRNKTAAKTAQQRADLAAGKVNQYGYTGRGVAKRWCTAQRQPGSSRTSQASSKSKLGTTTSKEAFRQKYGVDLQPTAAHNRARDDVQNAQAAFGQVGKITTRKDGSKKRVTTDEVVSVLRNGGTSNVLIRAALEIASLRPHHARHGRPLAQGRLQRRHARLQDRTGEGRRLEQPNDSARQRTGDSEAVVDGLSGPRRHPEGRSPPQGARAAPGAQAGRGAAEAAAVVHRAPERRVRQSSRSCPAEARCPRPVAKPAPAPRPTARSSAPRGPAGRLRQPGQGGREDGEPSASASDAGPGGREDRRGVRPQPSLGAVQRRRGQARRAEDRQARRRRRGQPLLRQAEARRTAGPPSSRRPVLRQGRQQVPAVGQVGRGSSRPRRSRRRR
jgi:hypothetical protein